MRNRQQSILLFTNLIIFFTGTGLYPLLPLFTARFGTSQAMMGVFLASLSGMNAAGALLAGRLLIRFSVKPLFIAGGAVGVPALLALSQASTFGLAMMAAVMLWFSGGFIGALLNVLTGLSAEAEARGRAFSLLFLASSLATVLGGTSVGALVTRVDYGPTFVILAAIWGLIPVLGWFLTGVKTMKVATAVSTTKPAALGRSFMLLLISYLAVTAAVQISNLTALLGMQAARFSPTAISSTTVVSGLASIPAALYAASLANRFGRQRLLLLNYFLVILTIFPLAGAAHLWHFSAGITMLLLTTSMVRPAVMALASDWLGPAALGRGLPLLEASVMGIGVVSSAATGYLLEVFGPAPVSMLAALLALAGGGVLLKLFAGERKRPFSNPFGHLFHRTRQIEPCLDTAVQRC